MTCRSEPVCRPGAARSRPEAESGFRNALQKRRRARAQGLSHQLIDSRGSVAAYVPADCARLTAFRRDSGGINRARALVAAPPRGRRCCQPLSARYQHGGPQGAALGRPSRVGLIRADQSRLRRLVAPARVTHRHRARWDCLCTDASTLSNGRKPAGGCVLEATRL